MRLVNNIYIFLRNCLEVRPSGDLGRSGAPISRVPSADGARALSAPEYSDST